MEEEFSREGIEKQKALIGDFVIQFEHLNDWIRFIIPEILFQMPVPEIDKNNVETLLTDIGAELLRSKFDSLVADNFSDYPDFIECNKKLSNKIANLTTIRNSIVHGTYRLGWKNFQAELSDSTFSLRHSKTTKNGYERRSKIISIEELEFLVQTMRRISACYNSISVIIQNIKVTKRMDLASKYLTQLENQLESINNPKLKHLDIIN
jgi:hypothetical protein